MSETTSTDFIRERVIQDIESNKHGGRVHTRFPPEPNGYLHIGHVKAICTDFGIAEEFGGKCNLRYDDTNPTKEETEYVTAIEEDVQWLGFQWDAIYYASDYFGRLYEWARQLIKQGDAYVDDLSADEIRAHRGTLTEPGKNSPYRDRSIEENLALFERMKNGEFPDGSHVLRAKIDMASPNINFRDPVMYRILHAEHHRTGDQWCIYPMYDWAHGQSDSIEGITHSLCTLEFENNRPLYDWFIEKLGIYAPQQIEFARLNVTHTLTSKRKLRELVEKELVNGWDDPRMPTIRGMRRRGYTAASLRAFIQSTGLAKANSTLDYQQLEFFVRDDLNIITPRVMAVIDPLKVIITNYPEGETEQFSVMNYPQDKSRTESRLVPFGREIYIEREDFSENPPPKWKRLAPNVEVRLFGAYYVTANEVVKDENGQIIELHCTYDPTTAGGDAPNKRKVQGTMHWVSAEHGLPATINLYELLFASEFPGAEENFLDGLNPDSLQVVQGIVEPSLAEAQPGDKFQFMRMGYFCADSDHRPNQLIFNRTATLRDTWTKNNQ